MLTIGLLTLGDPGQLTGGYLYHRRMADAAADHDARIRFVSFPVRPFPLPALQARRVLGRAIDAGADVLLVDSIAAAFVAPRAVLRRLERPFAAIIHQPPGGIDHRWPRTRLQAVLDVAAYRRARRLLVASDALAAELTAGGLPRDRVRVVAPGRDVAPAPSGPPVDLRDGRQAAFLSVGNWVERKGLLDLLDAFASVPAQAATLHLVGDDALDPAYARQVRARLSHPDLAGRVRVHGPVPKERVAQLYRSADVFVLPSRREPYGTVYGEAMAAGLPVVGWRAGNLPYLARDGRDGVVLPPGDVAGLSRALTRLASDADHRRVLAESARDRARSFPTWADTAELLFAELRAVADG